VWCHLWPLLFHHIFRHYLINGTIFEKKQLLNITRVFGFFLELLSKTFIILRRIRQDIVIYVKSLHVKYPLFLPDFNETWIFSTYFRKNLKYCVSSKPVQCEPSCSMRTDWQTDMTKLIVAFRSFANAPKNVAWSLSSDTYLQLNLTLKILKSSINTYKSQSINIRMISITYTC
jgi:hypothetical protein